MRHRYFYSCLSISRQAAIKLLVRCSIAYRIYRESRTFSVILTPVPSARISSRSQKRTIYIRNQASYHRQGVDREETILIATPRATVVPVATKIASYRPWYLASVVYSEVKKREEKKRRVHREAITRSGYFVRRPSASARCKNRITKRDSFMTTENNEDEFDRVTARDCAIEDIFFLSRDFANTIFRGIFSILLPPVFIVNYLIWKYV